MDHYLQLSSKFTCEQFRIIHPLPNIKQYDDGVQSLLFHASILITCTISNAEYTGLPLRIFRCVYVQPTDVIPAMLKINNTNGILISVVRGCFLTFLTSHKPLLCSMLVPHQTGLILLKLEWELRVKLIHLIWGKVIFVYVYQHWVSLGQCSC